MSALEDNKNGSPENVSTGNMTSKMWHKIGKIVHKCENAHDAGVKFMNNFKRI